MDGRRGAGRVGDLPSPDQLVAHSPDAERSVIGRVLANPRAVASVVGTMLEPAHFYDPAMNRLYGAIVTAYYNDDPIDAMSVGSSIARPLGRIWDCSPDEAVQHVTQMTLGRKGQDSVQVARDHAVLIKRHADSRALLDLSLSIQRRIAEGDTEPEALAGSVSYEAVRIAMSASTTHELIPFDELGRRVVKRQQRLQAARAAGIEVGAYFGLSFIDSYTRGLRPSDLLFMAGDPGAGKSAVSWVAATRFAERQMKKPKDRRIGTLVASLEMAEEPSTDRLTSTVTHLEGGKLREGRTDRVDLQKIVDEWHVRRDLPLVYNFSSTMRASQLRALCVEAIRRHNVGVVIIDHFRYLDMDPPPDRKRWDSSLEAEEALARFLKQDVATQLDIAVICLAHTNKFSGQKAADRPGLGNLRGGQLVAGHADYVAMVYRPYPFASAEDIEEENVKRTDAEMIWVKNRHGLSGSTADFYFDPSTMDIR